MGLGSLGSELRPVPAALRYEPVLSRPADAVLDFPCLALPDDAAACVGLTISWSHAHSLRPSALRATLADEHSRAASYLRPEDALRHLLGRALLRRLVACLGGDPRQPLTAGPQGKPSFEGAAFDCSISHASGQVWVAVARGAQCGIDVESQQSLPDASEVVSSFHPREAAAIGADATPELAALRCWTRKEAVAKATGLGLSLPLDSFRVAVNEAPSGWLLEPPPSERAEDWTTLDLVANADHRVALALRGRCREVRVLQLNMATEAA